MCKYHFNDYTPQEGDRVAIFKLGWTLVKEYLLFEWAPTDSNAKIHHVVFSSKYTENMLSVILNVGAPSMLYCFYKNLALILNENFCLYNAKILYLM